MLTPKSLLPALLLAGQPLFMDLARAADPSTSLGPGAAPAPAEMMEADIAFQEGRRLLAAGKPGAGCQRFLRSQSLYSSAVTLLNLANCYEQAQLEGGLVAALQTFELALTEGARLSDGALQRGVLAEAQRRSADLEARIPRLTLRRSPTKGAEVWLDGVRVSQLDTALRLNPGRHHLEVRAPGRVSHSQDIELAERRTLEVLLPALPHAATGGSSRTHPTHAVAIEPQPRRFGDGPLWLGAGALLLGGVAVVTGLSALGASQRYSRLRDDCDPMCSESQVRHMASERSNSQSYATATDLIVLPALGVTAGTALVLWWLDDFATADPAPVPPIRVQLAGTRRGWSLAAQGRF